MAGRGVRVDRVRHFTLQPEVAMMAKTWNLVRRLHKDENGATLVEYTVLLGILLGAVIVTIVAVGAWVNGQWTALNSAINP